MRSKRGFTLLEMLVATTIMGIAVAGLMSGLASTTRNAARLRDYDRVVQLARLRMNSLLAEPRVPLNMSQEGGFDRALTGDLECGWRARVSVFEQPPSAGRATMYWIAWRWRSGGCPVGSAVLSRWRATGGAPFDPRKWSQGRSHESNTEAQTHSRRDTDGVVDRGHAV